MSKPRERASFYVSGLGLDYPIWIDAPTGVEVDAAADEGERWIAVLCLDGDDQFADLCRARAVVLKEAAEKSGAKLPPLLLVGIGYGASYGKPGNRRSRDYTPVAIDEAPDAGGADAFLEFLTGTLWAELKKRYPVREDVRGITGYSLGGLFALHALFKPEPFFNRVLSASPSIWWGERAVLAAVAKVQAEARAVEMDARVFVSVGLKDSRSMTEDLDLLEAQLTERPVKGLDVRWARFPGFTHFNAIAVSFRTGLVELFGA